MLRAPAWFQHLILSHSNQMTMGIKMSCVRPWGDGNLNEEPENNRTEESSSCKLMILCRCNSSCSTIHSHNAAASASAPTNHNLISIISMSSDAAVDKCKFLSPPHLSRVCACNDERLLEFGKVVQFIAL